jgi:hypothetical protein
MNWLKGKKTYITALIYGIAAILNETGVYVVPEYLFQVLAAIGLITLRAGVSKK